MPDMAVMTDPIVRTPSPYPSPSSDGSVTPIRGYKPRRRRAMPQPTFHLNIGRVDIPRSLPSVRSLGTQTDESFVREDKIEDKKLYRRAAKWAKKWVMPCLRFGVKALGFCLSRIGFGIRIGR